MSELVKFSLKRRFINTSTILLNIMLCLVLGAAFFADKIVDLINPQLFDERIIYLCNLDDTITQSLLESEQTGIKFIVSEEDPEALVKENNSAVALEYQQGYIMHTLYKADSILVASLSALLSQTHQTLALSSLVSSAEEFESIMSPINIENKVLNESVEVSEDRQNLIFMVITSIYFTMLSFSTTVANEVIYEKSTKTLELILTSVSAKAHFLSKMIVGWLAIFIQMLLVCVYILMWFIIRNGVDQGSKLIAMASKAGLLNTSCKTFSELFGQVHIEPSFLLKLLFILAFLYTGILFIQMILVILSSFIANVEEAGNIQAPFYLILMGTYYFTLSVNTPYQMSEGIGFLLSFLPFFSMLFMPCRLLIQNVSLFELLLSYMISFGAIFLVVKEGSAVYQRGVLDYSSKGVLGVIKGILNHPGKEKL